MWHIIFIGYIFVTLMYSIAQYPQGIARVLIYLVFWTILPTLFAFWVLMTHRRNQRMKREEQLAQRDRDYLPEQ
ncbi:hypothetical protein ACKLNO_02415 [Neisseriaceae bacterium B1]